MTASAERGPGRPRRAAVPSWRERLDDPREPLYTVGVVAELLGIGAQALRRLEAAAAQESARPSGNQRRYSRRDIELLAAADELAREGFTGAALSRILALERRIQDGGDTNGAR